MTQTIMLQGEALELAKKMAEARQKAQTDMAELQREFQERHDKLVAAHNENAQAMWLELTSMMEIPENERSAESWMMDDDYVEHGFVFLKKAPLMDENPVAAMMQKIATGATEN